LLGVLLLASSGAVAAPPDGWTEVPLEPPASEDELVVFGTGAVRRAKEAVVAAFAAEGWRFVKTGDDGSLWFRGPESWMGSAVFLPSGLVDFRARYVSFEPVEVVEGPPSDGMEALSTRDGLDTQTRGGIQGPVNKDKLRGVRERLITKVDPKVRAYQAVLNETALRASLQTLPDRLTRTWTTGVPLDDGPPLVDNQARRAAILEYWASRAPGREGDLTAEAVEAWCRATWDGTPWALTEGDLAVIHKRRQ
jgi:hypothetical protein